MAIRQLDAVGPAAPELAWRRYASLAEWPTWSPQIREVRADGEHLAMGLHGRVRLVGGLTVPFVVTSCRPEAMTWSWTVRLGPVSLQLDHAVEPHAKGARTTLAVRGPVLVVAAYAPLAQLALHRLVGRGSVPISPG